MVTWGGNAAFTVGDRDSMGSLQNRLQGKICLGTFNLSVGMHKGESQGVAKTEEVCRFSKLQNLSYYVHLLFFNSFVSAIYTIIYACIAYSIPSPL